MEHRYKCCHMIRLLCHFNCIYFYYLEYPAARSPVTPPDECSWNNERIRLPHQKTCFCIYLFPFTRTPNQPHDNPIPTHIPWYLFHFHPLAGFCLKSMDRQTDLSRIIVRSLYSVNVEFIFSRIKKSTCSRTTVCVLRAC